jgi:hypothetical protein
MKQTQIVSMEYFLKRLADLCLKSGLAGFPKDEVDQHILLKSAMLTFGEGVLTESEVNDKLKVWVNQISHIKNIDHVTLRRRLVDTGYLTRSKDGAAYQRAADPRPGTFEAAIDQIDVPEALRMAREEIERRKREYLEKSKSKGE